MKFKTLFTCLLLLSALTLVGQNSETEKVSNKDSFSLSLETPFFYKDIYGEKGNVGYINFEFLPHSFPPASGGLLPAFPGSTPADLQCFCPNPAS